MREASKPPAELRVAVPDADQEALIQSLQRKLGTKVTLRRSRQGKGSLTIHFFSDEELEGVLDRLGMTEL